MKLGMFTFLSVKTNFIRYTPFTLKASRRERPLFLPLLYHNIGKFPALFVNF